MLKQSHMKVFVRNSQDLKRALGDANALNLETYLASLCDYCSMKASVVKNKMGSWK